MRSYHLIQFAQTLNNIYLNPKSFIPCQCVLESQSYEKKFTFQLIDCFTSSNVQYAADVNVNFFFAGVILSSSTSRSLM